MVAISRRPGADLGVKDAPNLRDLGGWRARGGKVRSGVLFRTVSITARQAEQAEAFSRLGVRYIYDLRTADERKLEPDKVPPGVDYISIDVLSDLNSAAGPARLVNAMSDPEAVEMILRSPDTAARIEASFRSMISLPSALAGYRQLFIDLAESEGGSSVIHCTTGKDRTGWASAALLLLLGVSEDDVYADYLLTNKQLLPALQPIVDDFVAAGGNPSLLKPILSVEAEYLDTTVDEMRQRFGSIEGYFYDGLQLDRSVVERLRAAFIERD
ncbi:phosphatase [Rhizocola hellebori]|uniref:Phosphatase n=1 Tax=Rhizocola hellebori TaxID=1392758 RepID=A0A8J3Q7Y1_9ACTN|nr:tyrosine-protein phosphatase [Rhizocola hellebori]GIH05521.1 phosphatase [Rhizocola hellebori]